jgi:hypothetical protein
MSLGEQYEPLQTPLEEQWQEDSAVACNKFLEVFGKAGATEGHVDLLNGGIDLTYEPGEEPHLPTFVANYAPGTIIDTRAFVVSHKYTDVVGMREDGRLDERPMATKYVMYVSDMSEELPNGEKPQRWMPYSVAKETYDLSEDDAVKRELKFRETQQEAGEGLEDINGDERDRQNLAQRVSYLKNRKTQLAQQRSAARPAPEKVISAESVETAQRLRELLEEAAMRIPTQSARAIVARETREDY